MNNDFIETINKVFDETESTLSNKNNDDVFAVLEEELTQIILDSSKNVNEVTIETSSFQRFRNAVDFISHPAGLGFSTLYEFPRQYQYLRDFYALLCPQCNIPALKSEVSYDCWGMSPAQLQDQVLFEEQPDGIYLCPKCKKTHQDYNIVVPQTLIGLAGMRSGKSILAAMILVYELHKDLLIDNPQKQWRLAPGQRVDYTCVSTKVEQAEGTIFSAISNMHENSPWFKKYNTVLIEQARSQGVPLDRVYVKNLTEIRYAHKHLHVEFAGTNSAGLAGKTRKVVIIDEIGRMIQTESRMGVDAVYDTLDRSLLTLSDFGSKLICISSPWLKNDKIMQLYQNAILANNPRVLAFCHPTWDFNPLFPREHPKIVEAFQQNPVNARRDYGCDPPGASDPWLPDEWRIDECIDEKNEPLFQVRDTTSLVSIDGKRIEMVAKHVIFTNFLTTKNIVIACDPGHLRDSFGMIVAYIKPVQTPNNDIEYHMFVGQSLAWVPQSNPRREVDFRNVIDVIKKLANFWHVDYVAYDQWQSTPLIQDLRSNNIRSGKESLTKDDWDSLATLFYTKQIHLLHPKHGYGAERLIFELKNLQLKGGNRIDHSPTSSSDIAVCLARAAKILLGATSSRKIPYIMQESHNPFHGQVIRFRR